MNGMALGGMHTCICADFPHTVSNFKKPTVLLKHTWLKIIIIDVAFPSYYCIAQNFEEA